MQSLWDLNLQLFPLLAQWYREGSWEMDGTSLLTSLYSCLATMELLNLMLLIYHLFWSDGEALWGPILLLWAGLMIWLMPMEMLWLGLTMFLLHRLNMIVVYMYINHRHPRIGKVLMVLSVISMLAGLVQM